MKRITRRLVGTLFAVAALACLALPGAAYSADGIEPLPSAFYGTITSTTGSSPSSVVVRALVDGVVYGQINSSGAWQYGGPGPLDPKLNVYDLENGTPLQFTIDGIPATPSDPAKAVFNNRETTELDLTYTPAGGGGGGGGGGGTPPTTTTTTTTTTATQSIHPVEVIVDGKTTILPISQIGTTGNVWEVLATVIESSPDNKVELTIPNGTEITVPDGTILDSISMTPFENPPAPPADETIIGLPYHGEPSGIIFNPPITMVWHYEDGDVPAGVNEADMRVAYYDEATGQWITLECVVDPETNTITVQIPHFTDFAIIAPMTTSTTTPSTTTTTTVTTPTSSATVTQTTATTSATTTSATTAPIQTTTPATTSSVPADSGTGTNWAIIGGAVGGVIIVALIVFFALRRKPAVKQT